MGNEKNILKALHTAKQKGMQYFMASVSPMMNRRINVTDKSVDGIATPKIQKQQKLVNTLKLWVLLPTLLSGFYYGLMASDSYESESKFTIQSSDRQAMSGFDSILGTLSGSGSANDSLAVQTYILSRDVLKRLNKEFDFIKHYQSHDADLLSRLGGNVTFEEAFEFYKGKVFVGYDAQSGVSTLKVNAFTAEMAQRFSNAILKYSEQLVNDMSQRAELDQLDFAKKEVAAGELRLAKARSEILAIQTKGKEINPVESATALIAIRSTLESELTKSRAELIEAQLFMRATAPKVVALKKHIVSLETQITAENLRLVNPEAQSLSASIAAFEPYVLEKEFAEKAYASALASLEIARVEAAQQHRYLATIVAPSEPDEATHPKRIMSVFTVFIISLTALGIGSLLIAAVREHARI